MVIAWQHDGNYLATAGSNRQVHIYDRYGQVVDDVGMTAGGQVTSMDWDADGETLVILQQNNSALIVWDLVTKKPNPVETNMKDLAWLKWSKTGPELAVGTVSLLTLFICLVDNFRCLSKLVSLTSPTSLENLEN